MRHAFVIFVFATTLLACNDTGTTVTVLDNPAYAPLTDSIKRFSTDAELRYRRGLLLHQNGEEALAAEDFKSAWSLRSDERYAFAYAELVAPTQQQAAIDFLKGANQKLPGSLPLQLQLARLYQQRGNRMEAIAITDGILKKYPASLDALLLQADLMMDSNPAEATHTLEQAHALAPNDVDVTHELAYAYAETGNAKLLALTDALIKTDVQDAHAEPHYFKGLYYATKKDYSTAVKHFDAAIQRDHNFMNAYINKGIVYYEQKQWQQAAETFALATRINPAFADAWHWLGKTAEAQGQKEQAQQFFERAKTIGAQSGASR